ncbi:MAG TPA: BatD family protein [Gammaproteobacteria bacterium]
MQLKLWLGLCLLLTTLPATAANIVTRTDRAEIGVNESFTLIFDALGGVDGNPDFTPLEELFDIANITESSSVSIANGQTLHQQTWTLTLYPKRAGLMTIPAIAFGSDQSPELQIEVTQQKSQAAGAGEDIFLTVDATPKDPYVQEQVVYTLRLYRAVNTVSASLSDLELSNRDAVIKQLGSDSTYETHQAGRRYAVYERRFTIFPQTAGKLTIQPVRFEGVVQENRRGFFDPFNRGGKRIQLMSDAIELNVKPIPATFNGAYWLPAKALRLTETWSPDPPAFKVGEAVTRTLAITAVGLTAAQLPELTPETPQHFKQYPDQPTLEDKQQGDNMTGVRLDKLALIPTQPGRYTLPAIEIPWWNTRTNKLETARLPAREIDVLPGATGSRIEDGAAETSPFNDAQEKQRQNHAPSDPAGVPSGGDAGVWPWLSLVLAVGWGVTGFAWWLSVVKRRRISRGNKHAKPRPDPKACAARLKKACTNNDAENAKTILLEWARAALPETAGRSLGNLAGYAGGDLGNEIMKLNAFLYRPQPGQPWSGGELWRAFQNADLPETRKVKTDTEILEPLYKIQANSNKE